MSMRVCFSSRRQPVRVGFAFQTDYSPPSGEGFPLEVYYHDLLLSHCRSRFYAVAGMADLSQVFGFWDVAGSPESLSASRRPSPFLDSERHNRASYGSFFQNLQLFGSVLGLSESPIVVAPEFEHPMRHSSFSGELLIDQQGTVELYTDYDFFGHSAHIRHTNGELRQIVYLDSIAPCQGDVMSWHSGDLCTFCIDDLCISLLGQSVQNFSSVDGQLTRRTLSGLEFSKSDSGLKISYDMRTDNLVDGVYCTWRSTIRIPFGYAAPSIVPVVGGGYWTSYWAPTTFSFDSGSTNSTADHLGRFSDSYKPGGTLSSFPVVLSGAHSDFHSSHSQAVSVTDQLQDGRFIKPFFDEITSNFGDIVGSSLFSSVDAFNSMEGYLGTNVLQNLAKLKDIASALPKIREAVDVLSRLTRRDLSISTFKEIMDLATSTHLQASFEWRPWLSILTDYLPRLSQTFETLGLRPQRLVGYGSFRAELHNALGRMDVSLLTRTKIVMSNGGNSWLTALTGLDALGILPKPSNLWDLLPFTFLVNWFTGVGAAMRRGEASVILASLPAYYVHTYTLSSPLTGDELRLVKASSDPSRPASLRVYIRDVTTFTPSPRDSRFDFGIPHGVPFIGTLGSLAYQLILG